MKLKTTLTPLFVLLLLCSTVLLTSTSSKEGDYDWLKNRLEATKAFTMEVIKAMPENKYDYKPGDDIRTYQELAYHVVYSINYYNRVFKGESQPKWNPEAEDSKSKAELIKWANEEFDAVNATILAASDNKPLTVGIMGYIDHNAHHRGNMITYLKTNGITPPSYR